MINRPTLSYYKNPTRWERTPVDNPTSYYDTNTYNASTSYTELTFLPGLDVMYWQHTNTNGYLGTYVSPYASAQTVSPGVFATETGGVPRSAYCPTNNSLYSTCKTATTVGVVNYHDKTTVTPTVAGQSTQYDIAYCVANDKMYCTTTSGVVPINCATNVPEALISIPGLAGRTWTQIIYCSFNNSMYIHASSLTSIYVVDCTTHIVTTVAIATAPHASTTRPMVWSPKNNTIYVGTSSTTSYKYIVVDQANFVGTASPGYGFLTGVYVPSRQLVYLCSTAGSIWYKIFPLGSGGGVSMGSMVGPTSYKMVWCPVNDCIYSPDNYLKRMAL